MIFRCLPVDLMAACTACLRIIRGVCVFDVVSAVGGVVIVASRTLKWDAIKLRCTDLICWCLCFWRALLSCLSTLAMVCVAGVLVWVVCAVVGVVITEKWLFMRMRCVATSLCSWSAVLLSATVRADSIAYSHAFRAGGVLASTVSSVVLISWREVLGNPTKPRRNCSRMFSVSSCISMLCSLSCSAVLRCFHMFQYTVWSWRMSPESHVIPCCWLPCC